MDSAIAIKCFGVGISYLVIVGDLMPEIVEYLLPDLSKDSMILKPSLWVTCYFIPLIPIAFFKNLNSLRFTSTIALFFVFYLVVVVIYYSLFDYSQHPEKIEYDLIKLNLQSFTKFPLFVFGFTCHQNVLLFY